MKEKKLQQLVSNGDVFIQEIFEEGPISSIVFQHPRSWTRTMMKQKNKAFVEEHVEKFVKKKPVSKAKESQKII